MKKFVKYYMSYFYTFALLILLSALTYCSDDKNNPVDEHDNENNDTLNLAGYELLWNDEFDGSEIDPSKWVHEVNGNGGGNNELQYYTDRPENSYVQEGKLYIIGRQEEYTGSDGTRYYTSARMTTQTTKSFMYGKIT